VGDLLEIFLDLEELGDSFRLGTFRNRVGDLYVLVEIERFDDVALVLVLPDQLKASPRPYDKSVSKR
jgi:hypothetical protein